MNEGFLRRYGSAIRESYEGSGEVIYNSATKEWERFEVEVELFRAEVICHLAYLVGG